MVELRENIESVKLIENLKVVMQQKVEMLKESLRKLTILIEQIVVRWREMIQIFVLVMKQKMEKNQMPDILVVESQKSTAERVFLVQGFKLIKVHYFI